MPRQARLDAPGILHHVMIRGMERKRIVEDEGDRQEFVRRLGKLAVETETAIYAWALMTNHAHILLSSGALGLAKFMRRFLTGYAVTICATVGTAICFRIAINPSSAMGTRILPSWYVTFTSILCDVKLVGNLSELERYATVRFLEPSNTSGNTATACFRNSAAEKAMPRAPTAGSSPKG
jgi:hypothetical protein